ERVDGDVHRPELLGERLRERDDRGLGGAVGGEPGVARLPGDRGDVHDPPAAAQTQEGDGGARAEEDALHVDGEDAVPLRLVHGERPPEAARGARDEGDLALELHVGVLTSRYRIASSPVMSRPMMRVCMSYVPS